MATAERMSYNASTPDSMALSAVTDGAGARTPHPARSRRATNRSQTRHFIGLATTLLVFAKNVLPAQTLTLDEEAALRQLCKAALNANGGIWSSEPINAPISTLAFGRNKPDGLQATAYTTCNTRNDLN